MDSAAEYLSNEPKTNVVSFFSQTLVTLIRQLV